MQNIACAGYCSRGAKTAQCNVVCKLTLPLAKKQNKKFLASHNFTKKFIKTIDIFIKKDIVALKKVLFAFLAENSEKAG